MIMYHGGFDIKKETNKQNTKVAVIGFQVK